MNGIFMRTNTCLVGVLGGRPSRSHSASALATAGSKGSAKATPVFGRTTFNVVAIQSISCSCNPMTSPAPKP